MEQLINNSADINARNVNGYTALYYAILNKEDKTTRLLLNMGAPINEVSEMGALIHLAVNKGSTSSAKWLIEGGANPNSKDFNDKTPLFWATNPVTAQMLIDYGADINAKDNKNNMPINEAARTGNIPVIKVLLKAGLNLKTGPAKDILKSNMVNSETRKILLAAGAKNYP